MARFNPDLMQLDDGATGTTRVFGTKTDTSKISESEIALASIEAGRELGVDSVTLAYEQGQAGISTGLNKMTPAELAAFQKGRSDKQTEERKFGTPDNPQPYDAPAGANWNLYGGVWKLYYKGTQIGDADGYDQKIIDKINTQGVNTPNAGNNGNNGNNPPPPASTVIPGSTGSSTTGGPSLAVNTFKNTLALFFGTAEMAKPWVDELYRLVNPYYKSGSSIDEALNLAIQEGKKNPNLKEFTTRFKGIYDLQDKLLQGVAVTVPTIAEFVATEAKMGDVLNQAGLSSLNQQSYLGDIIGKGVNVTEFTNRINNVFLRIDQLPQQAKDFIAGSFPTLDKNQLAKAILGGEKGAIQLSKELGGLEVQAAFKAQGLGVDTATGLDIASRGFGYQETLTGAGTVAQSLPTYEKLQEISSGKDIKTEQAQKELQGVVFNKSIVDSMRAEQLANQEAGRFRGSSGLAGSKSLASQQRGAGLI